MKQRIRCAIYTRKSTDEGLDKEFNTLEAQREAGINYIKSQYHQGWEIVEEHYDDGGFSGGNMNRPALQRLLDDVKADKIDMIVVYKIDRLTRSLLDFAKLIEILDAHQCSFAAVTQHFNTYDSMGRLTLNVLLSFAQFEREVSAERIRDKVAASKKKGMWMGGSVPLGYDTINKKLVINQKEKKIVEFIFNAYLKCRSEMQTCEMVNEKGWRTKPRIGRDGIDRGSQIFKHATVSAILRNPIYIGKMPHHDNVYDGQHEKIIEVETFNAVQAIKGLNRAGRLSPSKSVKNSLLKGMLICECCGTAMISTRAKRGSIFYEYYTSSTAVKEGYAKCQLGNLPAGELDEFVLHKVQELLQQPSLIQDVANYTKKENMPIAEAEVFQSFQNMDKVFNLLVSIEKRAILEQLIHKIIVSSTCIEFVWTNLGCHLYKIKNGVEKTSAKYNVSLARKRGRIQITIPTDSLQVKRVDPKLVKALSRAFTWQQKLSQDPKLLIKDLAIKEKVERTYMGKIIKLTLLAPDIIKSILEGKQPCKLTVEDFVRSDIPNLWDEQRRKYGFLTN